MMNTDHSPLVMIEPDWKSPDGRVWLFRGDCLKIMPRLPRGRIAMVFMDPPYGHNNNGDLIHRHDLALGTGGPRPARPIMNDGPEANGIFRRAVGQINDLLDDASCCCCCCCGGGGPDPQFAHWSQWMDELMRFKQAVVWDKGRIGMGWHYRRSYEMVLVAQKGKGRCRWYDRTRRIENVIRPGDYGIRKRIPKPDEHPTVKPVALPRHFIRLHSWVNQWVLDPFMGEGTTGIACVETGRKFIGIEKDRKWYRRAIEKIQEAQAKRVRG